MAKQMSEALDPSCVSEIHSHSRRRIQKAMHTFSNAISIRECVNMEGLDKTYHCPCMVSVC